MAKRKGKRVRSGSDIAFSVSRPSSSAKNASHAASTGELAVRQVKFTVELPEITRRSLKAMAAMEGISMRDFLLRALQQAGVEVP